MLDDVLTALQQIRERAERYRPLLTQNEGLTRSVLIDPLLRVLGWPLDDPAWVQVEIRTLNGGRVDYLLFDGTGRIFIIIEAKALGGKLDLAGSAAVGYAWQLHQQGTPPHLVGITDGLRWTLAEPHNLKEPKYQFDLGAKEPLPKLALQALEALWRDYRCAMLPRNETRVSVTSISENTLPLAELKVQPGVNPPTAILFPDGIERPLHSWKVLLLEVVAWLIDTGRLTEQQCPVPATGQPNGRYIAHTVPLHGSGKPFLAQRQVRQRIWVETHLNSLDLYRNACTVLERCGVSPARVQVCLG
ncbi:MAG: type I restriction endonuclease subunit R [Thermorudis peleae]|nr:type I restriction endonuclease subunit R [Thermorudis peleae]